MSNIDTNYIVKLINASPALTSAQKSWWKTRLKTMTEVQKFDLVSILERSLNTKANMFQKVFDIRKRTAHQKIQALYKYAEKRIEKEEVIELALLDQELESIEV